jgi:broad specificity phosphatase PhoE
MMMNLVLTRHGESEWNVDPAAGQDSPLTEPGHQQADLLGGWLAAHFEVDSVYASPLVRTRQTAETVSRHLRLDVAYDDDLRERHVPYQHPRPALPVARLGSSVILPPSYSEFYQQVARAVKRIVGTEPAGSVLVVAHAGTIGTFIRTLLGIHTIIVGTEKAATHHLRWADGRCTVVFLNRTDYLADLGAPVAK